MTRKLSFKPLWNGEEGSSLVELGLLTPVLLLMTLGALDFGRAYYLGMEVTGAAHAGAEYAVQNPTDTAGIQAAVAKDAPNVPNLSVAAPKYGCECSDGTLYSANCASIPSCTTNYVYRIDVGVSASYKPLFPWPGLPSNINLASSASMRSGGN